MATIEELGSGKKHRTGPTLSEPRRLAKDPVKAAVTVQKAAFCIGTKLMLLLGLELGGGLPPS